MTKFKAGKWNLLISPIIFITVHYNVVVGALNRPLCNIAFVQSLKELDNNLRHPGINRLALCTLKEYAFLLHWGKKEMFSSCRECDELKVRFAFLRQVKVVSKYTQPLERLNVDFNSLSPNK